MTTNNSSAGATSTDPSKRVKRKQYFNIGLLFVGAGIVAMGSAWLFSPKTPSGASAATVAAAAPKPKTVNIAVPGQAVSDKDAWRGKEAAVIADQSIRLSELDRQLTALKLRLEKQDKSTAPAPKPNPSGDAGEGGTNGQAVGRSLAKEVSKGLPTTQLGRNTPQNTQQTGAPPAQLTSYPPGRPNAALGLKAQPPGEQIEQVNLEPAGPRARLTRSALEPGERADVTKTVMSAAGDVVAAAGQALGTVAKTPENYLPSGSFWEGKLLSGIDAPSGGQSQNNPVPMLIEVSTDAFLPSHMRSEVKYCHVIATAYGDISAERAIARTESLSCIKADGTAIDIPIKGYIAGEDGKAGIRGRLVSKQGQILANALTAGLLQGLGSALNSASSVTTTNPFGGVSQTADSGKALQAGFGAGFSKSMDKLAQYYITLADKVFPVIEVDADRRITIVLTKGVFIDNRADSAASRSTGARPVDSAPAQPKPAFSVRPAYGQVSNSQTQPSGGGSPARP
jgi:conjugal transfer pilus assembly protein TraB